MCEKRVLFLWEIFIVAARSKVKCQRSKALKGMLPQNKKALCQMLG